MKHAYVPTIWGAFVGPVLVVLLLVLVCNQQPPTECVGPCESVPTVGMGR